MFGLRDWDNGLPHKKPTGFLTASRPVKERLGVRCSGNHLHQVLEGGQRTKRSQEWTPELCTAILDGFLEELEDRTAHAAFFQESIEEQDHEEEIHLGTLDAVQDDRDFALPKDLRPDHLREDELQRQEALEEKPIALGEEMEMEQTRRQKWLRIPRPTRLALRRLHTMTGHSTNSAMIQLLRTANASAPVIEACRHFACESCRKKQETQRPHAIPRCRVVPLSIMRLRLIVLKFETQLETGTLFCQQFVLEPFSISAGG